MSVSVDIAPPAVCAREIPSLAFLIATVIPRSWLVIRAPWFRHSFTLPKKPHSATAYVNALGYYELYVNGKKVDDYVLAPAVVD
ncbi:alpha-L-rhamnosidase N-terminal domain-containing protein, partial [Pseudomonas sp.]|uniref:alpha-L-rhamnosidase N-terminal domain-containing protein n=1 Tax=Pseudomonas sp. TaxID=306 RepID=UPI003F96CB98